MERRDFSSLQDVLDYPSQIQFIYWFVLFNSFLFYQIFPSCLLIKVSDRNEEWRRKRNRKPERFSVSLEVIDNKIRKLKDVLRRLYIYIYKGFSGSGSICFIYFHFLSILLFHDYRHWSWIFLYYDSLFIFIYFISSCPLLLLRALMFFLDLFFLFFYLLSFFYSMVFGVFFSFLFLFYIFSNNFYLFPYIFFILVN